MKTTFAGNITVNHRGDWSGDAVITGTDSKGFRFSVTVIGEDVFKLARLIAADELEMRLKTAIENALEKE